MLERAEEVRSELEANGINVSGNHIEGYGREDDPFEVPGEKARLVGAILLRNRYFMRHGSVSDSKIGPHSVTAALGTSGEISWYKIKTDNGVEDGSFVGPWASYDGSLSTDELEIIEAGLWSPPGSVAVWLPEEYRNK